MIAIDLTVLRLVRLMVPCMPDPLPRKALPVDALQRFTIAELAQVLALSRHSRRPIKRLLHNKGLPDNTEHVVSLLASIASHPRTKEITELAAMIDGAIQLYVGNSANDHQRDRRLQSRTPDQST